MKIKAFAIRNAKEILRDPLSYIFCLGFPVMMLIIMTIVNKSIPEEAAMDVFNMDKLAPSIVVFGFTFLMLFITILLSKDRNSNFLTRIYCAPIKPWELMTGYELPVALIGMGQAGVVCISVLISSIFGGEEVSIMGLGVCVAVLIPVMLMFISLGMILGAVFSEKAAPPIGSVVISVASVLGGMWMDIDAIGGTFLEVAKILPFYWCCRIGRAAVVLEVEKVMLCIPVVLAYCLVLWALASWVLRKTMDKE